MQQQLLFKEFENVDNLLIQLEARLPTAVNIFNLVKLYPKFKDEMRLYVLSKEDLETAWILVLLNLADKSQEISISVPNDPFAVFSQEFVKEAFLASDILDWKRPYRFASLDRRITNIFIDICFHEKGHIIELLLDIVYSMDQETATALAANNLTVDSKEFDLKSLNDEAGKEFLLKTWRHTDEGTDKIIEPFLKRNVSAGIYIGGKPVAGVVQSSMGYLGMLYTLPEYRKKGYAKICMLHAMKEMIKQGFVPATSVETYNSASHAFQLSLELKPLPGIVHYLYSNPDSY